MASTSSKNLMISISGVRGTIPEGLNLETILKYSKAFADTISSSNIVIGRDSRPSGEYIESIVTGVLLASNKTVTKLGITTTPTVKSVVKETNSGGGIMLSASHNPIEWNAFKFIGKNGFFFNQKEMDSLLALIDSQTVKPIVYSPKGTIQSGEEFAQLHIDSVLKRVDVAKIRKKKFKVFVDAVNGGGSFMIPKLLKALGCTVIEYNCKPDGKFPRPPEPTPKALVKTSKEMKSSGADIGFALDPDADRLVVLTPERGAIHEEYTLPLAIQSILKTENSKSVVVNLSTSFIIEEVLKPFSKKLVRSKVGEANVVADMISSKAFFGGEGNGGVIDPLVSSFGRDSLSGIAHILNFLTSEKLTIDTAVSNLPEIFMEKTSVPIQSDWNEVKNKLKESFPQAKLDERDGIRFDLQDSWLHVRASNTEPILRIIGEAKTKGDLKNLIQTASNIVK